MRWEIIFKVVVCVCVAIYGGFGWQPSCTSAISDAPKKNQKLRDVKEFQSYSLTSTKTSTCFPTNLNKGIRVRKTRKMYLLYYDNG